MVALCRPIAILAIPASLPRRPATSSIVPCYRLAGFGILPSLHAKSPAISHRASFNPRLTSHHGIFTATRPCVFCHSPLCYFYLPRSRLLGHSTHLYLTSLTSDQHRPYDVRIWQAQGMCYQEMSRCVPPHPFLSSPVCRLPRHLAKP